MEQIAFSLRELIGQVRDVVQTQASETKLAFYCRVAETVQDNLIGNPAQLREVLLHLMANAIEVDVTPASWDQASGFAGLHFTIRNATGATLPASSQLAEQIDGRLWVESPPDAISKFHFTCLLRIDPQTVAADSPLAVDQPSHALRILLAEDNPINQRLLTALLEKRNHHVRVVRTGLEAVQIWEHEHFDVILMDNEMPEMSGVEAVNRIRAHEREFQRARTPIIALTASVMIGDREQFLSAGMDGYLAKPFQPEKLYDVLRQVIAANHIANRPDP